jgi:hypothetical protein
MGGSTVLTMPTHLQDAERAIELYDRAYNPELSAAERRVALQQLDGELRIMREHSLDLYYRTIRLRRLYQGKSRSV